jgi:hypothetical protein
MMKATEEERMTTAAALREQAAQHEQDAAESFERCDTDGFLSQWASGLNAQQARKQANIEEAGGIATFFRYRLETLEGEAVAAKLINGRYGECWALCDEQGTFTGKFISAFPARASTMAKKGYVEVKEEFVAEAKAMIRGSGTGLSGAASCYVSVGTKEAGIEYTGVSGLGDCREES